jgi:hypothetical protein
MGIFSRRPKASTSQRAATGSSSDFIGRKFRSSLSLQECLKNYAEVSGECYTVAGPMYDVPWHTPTPPPSFQPSQSALPAMPPTRAVATDLTQGGRIYLALWDGMVSYSSDTPKAGPPCEMWFVSPDYGALSFPIAGKWKMRDSSLSSIGSVEGKLWGIRGKD